MFIEFLSIIIFAFALALFSLGVFTWWIERGDKRTLGPLMMLSGLVIAFGYAFLGSRYAIALFDRLIITIDLPRLMSTAIVYTAGMLMGIGLAGGLFIWISGRLVKPTRFERKLGIFITIVLAIGLLISFIAIRLSQLN